MQKVCFVIRFSFCFFLFVLLPSLNENIHRMRNRICIIFLSRIGANMYNIMYISFSFFKTQGSSVKQKRLNATAQLGLSTTDLPHDLR